jgi:hypothetical protein
MFESKRDYSYRVNSQREIQTVTQKEFISVLLLAICFCFGEKPSSDS